jgi:tetratricopeptide (TPR) repeat protein
VTASDPAVLVFSRNVNSFVRQKVRGEFNQNLLSALAIFDALQLYGLTYSADPIPTLTRNNQVADYIEFPRQTLQYKGGKCSDFSVLYAALLESVGIETAFITTPGHIFVAFSTGLTPDKADRLFSRPDELIARAEKSWIPVEVTESAGFLQAWQDGAREWKENLAGRQAAFYAMHDAWKLYQPIGLPGTDVTPSLPDPEKIVQKYLEEMDRFVLREISSRVAELQSQIEKARDPRKPRNSLGVLYARYGKLDLARREFEKLAAQEEYFPALMNLGNLLYLDGQKEKALEYYNRAYTKDPENPGAILAVARASDDLGQFDRAKQLYAVLKEKDPALAQRFAYLGTPGTEGTRAADVSDERSAVVWDE